MIKLCTAADMTQLAILRLNLESIGIPCVVKNENLTALSGFVPFSEVLPEIWVEEEDLQRAAELLTEDSEAETSDDS